MKTIRLADIKPNDIADGHGVCVSVWLQGCPHHCLGCHNPETWDFNGGTEYNQDEIIEDIINLIYKNNVKRNLSVLGGEPLCDQNIEFTTKLLQRTKDIYPEVTTYLWTGSTYERLVKKYGREVFNYIDILIDGPFILCQRDITLDLRGSTNQRVLYRNVDF